MRRSLAVVAVLLVALAGCGGAAGPGESAPNGTENGTENATDGYPVQEVIAATEAVDAYRVASNVTVNQSANGVSRTTETVSRLAVNRTAMTLRVNQSVESAAGEANVRQYFVNGTLYRYGPTATGGTGWRARSVDNVSRAWDSLDTLYRQRLVLERSNVTVVGSATVDGTPARHLALDVNETAYERLAAASSASGASLNVTEAAFEMWVANESDRILRTEGVLRTTASVRSRSVQANQTLVLDFTYEPVTVEVPEAALNATSASA